MFACVHHYSCQGPTSPCLQLTTPLSLSLYLSVSTARYSHLYDSPSKVYCPRGYSKGRAEQVIAKQNLFPYPLGSFYDVELPPAQPNVNIHNLHSLTHSLHML